MTNFSYNFDTFLTPSKYLCKNVCKTTFSGLILSLSKNEVEVLIRNT